MREVECMTEYRITKYNPANRIDGIYMADEWTGFSDIGKVFGGTKLSQDIYLKTERAYIDWLLYRIDWEIANIKPFYWAARVLCGERPFSIKHFQHKGDSSSYFSVPSRTMLAKAPRWGFLYPFWLWLLYVHRFFAAHWSCLRNCCTVWLVLWAISQSL